MKFYFGLFSLAFLLFFFLICVSAETCNSNFGYCNPNLPQIFEEEEEEVGITYLNITYQNTTETDPVWTAVSGDYVPYLGATGFVWLGNNDLMARFLYASTSVEGYNWTTISDKGIQLTHTEDEYEYTNEWYIQHQKENLTVNWYAYGYAGIKPSFNIQANTTITGTLNLKGQICNSTDNCFTLKDLNATGESFSTDTNLTMKANITMIDGVINTYQNNARTNRQNFWINENKGAGDSGMSFMTSQKNWTIGIDATTGRLVFSNADIDSADIMGTYTMELSNTGDIILNRAGWAGGGNFTQYSKTSTDEVFDIFTAILDRGSGSGGAGMGLGYLFRLEDGGGSREDAGRFTYEWQDPTDTSEDSKFTIQTMTNGKMSPKMSINGTHIRMNVSNLMIGSRENDSCLYFFEDGSEIGESLCWIDDLDMFVFSDYLSVQYINAIYSVTGATVTGTNEVTSGGSYVGNPNLIEEAGYFACWKAHQPESPLETAILTYHETDCTAGEPPP